MSALYTQVTHMLHTCYTQVTHRFPSNTSEEEFWFRLELDEEPRCIPAAGATRPATLFCTAIASTYSKNKGGEFGGVAGVVCATQSPANE